MSKLFFQNYHYHYGIYHYPYINQIDHVLIKNTFRQLVYNSRSYGSFETNPDHKAVIMNLKLTSWKVTKKFVEKSVTIDIEKISNEEKAKEYARICKNMQDTNKK